MQQPWALFTRPVAHSASLRVVTSKKKKCLQTLSDVPCRGKITLIERTVMQAHGQTQGMMTGRRVRELGKAGNREMIKG